MTDVERIAALALTWDEHVRAHFAEAGDFIMDTSFEACQQEPCTQWDQATRARLRFEDGGVPVLEDR